MNKKLFIAISAVLIFLPLQIFCCGCGYTNGGSAEICVRADSASVQAYGAATTVAEVLNEYINTECLGATAEQIEKRQDCICIIANSVLARLGYGYKSRAEREGNLFTVVLGLGRGATTASKSVSAESERLYKSVIAEIAKKYF